MKEYTVKVKEEREGYLTLMADSGEEALIIALEQVECTHNRVRIATFKEVVKRQGVDPQKQ